jgi:hypothetical protein
MRLDEFIAEQGWAKTDRHARTLIRRGDVLVDNEAVRDVNFQDDGLNTERVRLSGLGRPPERPKKPKKEMSKALQAAHAARQKGWSRGDTSHLKVPKGATRARPEHVQQLIDKYSGRGGRYAEVGLNHSPYYDRQDGLVCVYASSGSQAAAQLRRCGAALFAFKEDGVHRGKGSEEWSIFMWFLISAFRNVSSAFRKLGSEMELDESEINIELDDAGEVIPYGVTPGEE